MVFCDTFRTFFIFLWAQCHVDHLTPIQERYYALIDSPELDEILDEGAVKANAIASKTLKKMENAMGLGRKRR